jgi:hypothetical protein
MKKLFSKILIFTLVIIGTVLVIYYAKGYRINFLDNTVIQTGILHIQTQPNRANFYLTEDFEGKTSKVVTSIPKGKYNLDIWLEGYHDMKYEIEILPERSTPLSVSLFKKDPESKTIETIEKPILETHIDHSRNTALILVEESKTEDETNYEVLKYQTNSKFWQFRTNPYSLYTFSIGASDEIKNFSVSPNFKNLLLEITSEQEEVEEESENLPAGINLISLDTQTVLTTLDPIEQEIKWAHDGESIFWKDTEGIKKINLKEPETALLIYTNSKDVELIYYDTYTNGEFYILYQQKDKEYITLSKIIALEETPLIEEIYYQGEKRFLEEWQSAESIEYQTFTSSPQSTLLVGKPTDFAISKETLKILFNTEFASYLYDTTEEKFTLISPYKTKFLSFSPDNHKLAFLNLETEELGFFTFEREIGNESITLGGNYIAKYINEDICPDFAWHRNSQNIYYVCENGLYVADIRNFESINLVENFGKKILLETDKKIITLQEKENSTYIVEITIN